MGFDDIEFVGLAIVYGVAISLILTGILRLCAHPRPWHYFAFLSITLTFLFLTQHPFPAPGTLHCPVATATPQLVPFRYLEALARLSRKDALVTDYLTNRLLLASAMNFVICCAIGVALVRHMQAWPWIIAFCVMLSVVVEFTQLTGVWGTFPCAYRQFNVDDLILNILGAFCGVLGARKWKESSD